MPKAPEGYQPLLNRGTLGSLWLADDHLLVIETTRFLLCIRETYRRLDFNNIQAVLHTKSQRGTWLIVLFILILCASLGILAIAGFDSRAAQFTTGAMALPTLVAMVAHIIRGQTSTLIIQTTVHPWRLKMVTRQSHVLQILAALEPLCREAQQDISTLSPTPDRPQANTFKPIPSVTHVQADAPASVAGAHPVATPAWLCLLAYAAMMGGEMIWNSIPATLLTLGFATASFIFIMIAFTRGGGSLALGGRGVFLFALSMLGISLVAGYAVSMTGLMQSSMSGTQSHFSTEELFLRTLAEFPEGSPDAISIAAWAIIALTGISALAGLLAAARRNKLQRSNMSGLEASTPPSS